VSGVTYTLLNKTESSKPVTVSVSQDTDKIIENVKKFVEDYNKILDDLTKKYNTKPSGDYEPLSKTQEAGMTQEQIDKWTEKAKEGLFYHNDILRTLISDMRDAIMTPVQSVHSEYNSASAIGITSTNNQGHLQLDVDKLKKALAADPDCVYELFASDQDTYTDAKRNDRYEYMAKDDFNNRGIANRLYFNAITDGIKKVEDFAGVLPNSNDQSSLGLLITQLKDRMTDFKKMMDDYQTQLYKRYDALETMIASLNSQYNTLFGGQQ
ncbi:MAG: flagellar filament capping protein FliD, partial [Schwartzia sp.]|nr:flagellar filament capping protein FliD [Schwartzia sp. (in: firmicutes)]